MPHHVRLWQKRNMPYHARLRKKRNMPYHARLRKKRNMPHHARLWQERSPPMYKYIIKRILIAIPVLIGITIIDYAIMCMAGSPL